MALLPKLIYKFKEIPRNSNAIFHQCRKAIQNNTEPQNITNNQRKSKNTVKDITISDLKLYNRALVIKTALLWQKKKQVQPMGHNKRSENKPTNLQLWQRWQKHALGKELETHDEKNSIPLSFALYKNKSEIDQKH